MTAAPYTIDMHIPKLGITLLLYGVALLRALAGVREWQRKNGCAYFPRLPGCLPPASF
jgi:hypothetical protein